MKDQFFRWDYDKREVIEYERQGECNGCGRCCSDTTRYALQGRQTDGQAPMGDSADGQGVWSEVRRGKARRLVRLLEVIPKEESSCTHYKEGQCLVQGQKSLAFNKSFALCEAWPVIPDHVALFEECSYTFVEVGRWDF